MHNRRTSCRLLTAFRSGICGLCVLLLGLTAVAGSAIAAGDLVSDWRGIPEAEVRIIAGTTPDGATYTGIEFVIADGWKVYWRSPGDAGYPPVAAWQAPAGTTVGPLAWPLPHRFIFYGLETFGYEGHLVLPAPVHQVTPVGGPLHLDLSYAACAEICVPVEATLDLPLPDGPWPQNRHGRALAKALSDVPVPVDAHGVRVEIVGQPATGASSTPDPVLQITLPAGIADRLDTAGPPALIVEGPPETLFDARQCRRNGTGLTCRAAVLTHQPIGELADVPLILTLHDGTRGIEIRTRVRP